MIGIRTRIILSSLFIILFVGLVFWGIYFFFVSDVFRKNAESSFLAENQNYANSIETKNRLIEDHVNFLALVVEQDFNYSLALNNKTYLEQRVRINDPYVKNFLNESFNADSSIVSDYMVYSVENFGGLYQNWYVLDGGKIFAQTEDDIATYYPENPDMIWYYGPKESGVAGWTDAYVDVITNVSMISYVKPIYIYENREKKFLGVLGVDLSLDSITKMLSANNFSGYGFSFLLDKNNEYVSVSKENISSDLMNSLIQDKKTKELGIVSDSDKTVAFFVLENGQTVVSVIETRGLLVGIRNFEIIIFIFALVIVGIIFIFGYYIVSKLIDSVNRLYFASKELRSGNFKTRVDIKTNDEFEELGSAFNKMAESLERTDVDRKQIDKAKTEFISITSHELRSPMTPMKAQLQMLMDNYFGKLNEKQKESLDIVLRNTERLDKIIVDFLEISRIEAARLKFNFVRTSLEQPIKMVVEEMKGFMPEKKIEIRLRMDKLPVMEVDPDRVMQVLRNLLNNATKFSNVGGKIVVEVERKHGFILFSVQDFGIGIAKEAQDRIFEPFFQAEQTMYRQYGGTGLGLAICKGIVESQNGRIWFDSEKGQGTRFYFTVPLRPIRDIKPIRLLFSNKVNQEEAIKKLMIEFLGPLGESEFNEIKKQGINEKAVLSYMEDLKKNKIVEDLEEFKYRLGLIFGEIKKEESVSEKLSIRDLKRAGLID